MTSIGAVANSTAFNLQGNGIGMQDFMKILLTQLQYQDPLKPMDNQEFMAQVAQFTALQETQQLNEKMDSLLSTQASLQSVGLIGRTVDIAVDGSTLSGQVTALSLKGDAPLITVQTTSGSTLSDISLSQVQAVR
jgi:flagellar basal-body rod modification protein FlgD